MVPGVGFEPTPTFVGVCSNPTPGTMLCSLNNFTLAFHVKGLLELALAFGIGLFPGELAFSQVNIVFQSTQM